MSKFQEWMDSLIGKSQEVPIPSYLTDADRRDLVQVRAMPGYQTILKMLEHECEIAETEHFRVNPTDTEAVLATHNTARAMRQLFERFQKKAEYEANELLDYERNRDEATQGLPTD